MKLNKSTVLLSLGLLLNLPGAVHASPTEYEYSGTFTDGTLADRYFYGSYTYDDQTNQLSAFSQAYDGFVTIFNLSDFASVVVTDFQTFSLTSQYLEISFEDTQSRSNHLKWYDWSVWNAIDYGEVPMTGDTLGLVDITGVPAIPEPSTVLLLAGGLAAVAYLGKRRRRVGAARD